jgi:hypothetical protein
MLAEPKAIWVVYNMTQVYFGFCSMRDPKIGGAWRSPSTTCALGYA